MPKQNENEKYAPNFEKNQYDGHDEWYLSPFFTNLNKSVYAPLIFSPELIGALCSRASRATEDLRHIFLHEFIYPFAASDEDNTEYSNDLKHFIQFLHDHPLTALYHNPKARKFYIKWLGQFGDDSIAQVAGSHLVYSGISQVTIKHFEDQRIGLAPIEKSTRYVDYSRKVNGQYAYYTDPTITELGLESKYSIAMDGLFETYIQLKPRLIDWLSRQFPDEKPISIEKKALDTLRGLLPMSTLSQVAFFGNGQAFEHMINRSVEHPLGEIRWAGRRGLEELYEITPAFLHRLVSEEKAGIITNYQQYLAGKGERVREYAQKILPEHVPSSWPEVSMIDWDEEGQEKIIAGILYDAPENLHSWQQTLDYVEGLEPAEWEEILDLYLAGRSARWQKVGRAFENAYVRFEIVTNIGAWRDIHRHRMQTQQRQRCTCRHGYDVPAEVSEAGLDKPFKAAIKQAEDIFWKLENHDPYLAQYAVTLSHRLRFTQWTNVRQCFWEIELRTIPEGHPDYRRVEQQKFRLLEAVYPLITKRIMVNLGEYDFARRGQEEKIQSKSRKLESLLSYGNNP